MDSFQTNLIPNPEKLYKWYYVKRNTQKHAGECALQTLSTSGAGGLAAVHEKLGWLETRLAQNTSSYLKLA